MKNWKIEGLRIGKLIEDLKIDQLKIKLKI